MTSLIDLIRRTGSLTPNLDAVETVEVGLPIPGQAVEVRWLTKVWPPEFELRRALVSVLHMEREAGSCYVDVIFENGGHARITDLSQIRPLSE